MYLYCHIAVPKVKTNKALSAPRFRVAGFAKYSFFFIFDTKIIGENYCFLIFKAAVMYLQKHKWHKTHLEPTYLIEL